MVSPSSGAFGRIGNLGSLGCPNMRVAVSKKKARKNLVVLPYLTERGMAKMVPSGDFG
jgi:hypothetical protein